MEYNINKNNRKGENDYSISSLIVIIIVGIIAGIPIIINGFWTVLHDSCYHSVWYINFVQQFFKGELYPRWLMDMNYGLGSPAFFYYPPIPYYFTSIFYPFVKNDPAGWHQLGLGSTLSLLISGIGFWFWIKNYVSSIASLISALFYVIAPYHLADDLYIRGAYAELWAFCWLPFIFYGIDIISNNNKYGIILVAVSYGLLVTTHLPTTLLFSAFPLLYSLIKSKYVHKYKYSLYTFISMLWGISLASIYIIPALTMQKYVDIKELTNHPNLSYENNFIFNGLYFGEDKFRSDLFLHIIITAGIGILSIIITLIQKDRSISLLMPMLWYINLCITIYIMTPFSKILWDYIPKLKYVQFPWRATSILTITASVLLAYGIQSMRKNASIYNKMLDIILLLFIGTAIWCDLNTIKRYYNRKPNSPVELLLSQQDLPEYRTIWRKTTLINITDNININNNIDIKNKFTDGIIPVLPRTIVKRENYAAVVLKNGSGTISIEDWQPRHINIRLNVNSLTKCEISRFYYPGYQAKINGRPIEILPSNPNGFLYVVVPNGYRELDIKLSYMLPEILGIIISLLAICVMIMYYIYIRVYCKH
ncbi:MAG: 6-pyruvoyl-tetrahydropterin synthase-related protein [Verrucomicrobiia bacterium]